MILLSSFHNAPSGIYASHESQMVTRKKGMEKKGRQNVGNLKQIA